MSESYDVLIIGGGMVGASLACALADQPLRVGVIEGEPLRSAGQPGRDDRSIALAYGSRRIFEGMGLWSELAPEAEAIRRIHVSDRGHFAAARLDCAQHGVDALGYVLAAQALGETLQRRLTGLDNVKMVCPVRLSGLTFAPHAVQVSVDAPDGPRVLQAALVVGADGAQSTVRECLQIPVSRWDYGQTAIIANVTFECAHRNVAYERFTETGPIAVLPLHAQPGVDEPGGYCALVWTVGNGQLQDILGLDDAEFLARLQERFGHRLGRALRVGARSAYPLALVRVRRQVQERVALIGNAAHALHPVAGQGFNLGIRDVAVLAELLAGARARGADVGELGLLNEYTAWRQQDHRTVIGFTDALVRLFSNPLLPVAWVRGLGLLGVDLLPPVKRRLVRRSMGLAGRLPRLARGLPLRASQ
ncbi:MAG: 2-octaprenyl-6-methoxyphenyl hydroxylase [Gammaproteobacteria bacterium]|nr:2-octaprenyl-6-methoxyphenyl hydroxylase [Gammaproteobacteria bacterium]NIR98425.1 2-octaprenyl-6-methoxyphenyl hydroxylase [Gammaproteobacteria bacterium]NIT64172.1 2-octaprenyl-6-methoxyphenyl hydroxylase [Gammaproteobacteria bacterium]NIV21112.1 2-octaprenyl-6-methoxyphenyl hydroxylase [Gammaproteobacteria bacterium]NIX10589.1 2-octaprenyl-6-methoxyphenyl hydroxylase [Gammaproteobacteria bacterium]